MHSSYFEGFEDLTTRASNHVDGRVAEYDWFQAGDELTHGAPAGYEHGAPATLQTVKVILT